MDIKYIRVSTAGQKTDRQEDSNLKLFKDECSGSIAFADRPKAKKVIKLAEGGGIDSIHVHSIDRLGRNTLDILNTIQFFTNLGVNVVSKKEGLSTLIDGKENPTAKMMISIMATLAEFELNMIKERQREGIAIAKAKGSYKGNGGKPKESIEQFLNKDKNAKCYKLLKHEQLSIRRASAIAGVSVGTANKIKKIINDER